MLAGAFDADDAPVLDVRDPRARVLAVVRTTSFYELAISHGMHVVQGGGRREGAVTRDAAASCSGCQLIADGWRPCAPSYELR
jgi:hypothetical protein